MKKLFLLGLLAVIAIVSVAGCNATKGAGKDVENAGKHIENIGK